MAAHAVKILLALTATVISVIYTADALNVAHNTTTTFTCRGRVPYPAWYLDDIVPIRPPQFTVDYEPSTGDFLGVLVIDGNKSGGTLDFSCVVDGQTAYTIRLTIEGPLPSPENVTLSSQNSSPQLQWKPPYYMMNNESDVIQVYPHITHYTVYTIDAQYTRRMIGMVNKTETSFTLFSSNIQNDGPCPMYRVSAWNAAGEGELSEPVQESTPQAEDITVELTAESEALNLHIEVDVVCPSKMPEFLFITLLTSAEIVLSELTIHQPAQSVTDITISIPQSVDLCTLWGRISAGNSAGMYHSEPVKVVCSGGNTDSTTYTIASTTAYTTTTVSTNTQSGSSGQEADNTTLIVVLIGIIVAIGGMWIAALAAVGIIYCRGQRKGKVKNREIEMKPNQAYETVTRAQSETQVHTEPCPAYEVVVQAHH